MKIETEHFIFTAFMLIFLSFLVGYLVFAGSSATIQGKILGNDSSPANGVNVTVHTRIDGDCNCSADGEITNAQGVYVEASDNLRFDADCASEGTGAGDVCDGVWDNNDELWITIDGSVGSPTQPNGSSPYDPIYNWSMRYVQSQFAYVINWSLDPYPYWSNNKTYPDSGSPYSPTTQHQFNITWQDNVNISTVLFEHNFSGGALTNTSYTGKSGDEYYYNAGTLPPGTYLWRTFANDSGNNWNQSDQWSYVVAKASSAVYLYLNGSRANFAILEGDYVNISANLINGTGDILVYNKGSLIYNGSSPSENITQFNTGGLYNITAVYSETQNYSSSSETWWINVSIIDNAPTTLLISPDNGNVSLTGNVSFVCNATDDYKLDNITFYWNYTGTWQDAGSVPLSVNSSVVSFNKTNLDNGIIVWDCLACDNASQYSWASSNRTLNVSVPDYYPYWSNNQTSIVSTYSPITQSYFNITWQDDKNVSIVRFESNYSGTAYNYSMNNLSNDVYTYSAILPAGTFYWKSYANDTADQWNNSDTWYFTIAQASPVLTISASTTWTETYATSTTINCTADNTEVTPQLYLAGSPVANPYTTTHNTGTYNYTCNSTTTQNYTTGTEVSQILTINQNSSSEVNLLLNGNDSNVTINVGNDVNITSSIVTPGSGYMELYRNGVLINSGNDSLSNTSTYNNAGTYNVTAIYNETQNYASASETHFIIVQDTQDPVIISTELVPYDPAIGETVFLNMSVSDNGAISGRFANITLPNTTVITVALDYNYPVQIQGRHNVTFWVNDSAGNIATFEDYFIAGTLPFNITFNVVNSSMAGVPANLTIYFADTNKTIDQHYFIGIKLDDDHTNILYDLYYIVINGYLTVRLNDVNLSIDYNDTLGIDRGTNISDYLVTYGLYDTYNFTSADVTFSYAGTNYTDESGLEVYRCSDWNFTTQICSGNWTEVTDAVQNLAADTFTVSAPTFSAYSVSQGAPAVAPPTGGGGGGGARRECNDNRDNDGDGLIDYPDDPGCENANDDDEEDVSCKQNWACGSWSECDGNVMQYRTCNDLNDCEGKLSRGEVSVVEESPKPVEERECAECVPEWECSEWDPVECPPIEEGGTLTRTCNDLNSCGTDVGKPDETYTCPLEVEAGVAFPEERPAIGGMAFAFIKGNIKMVGIIGLMLFSLLLLLLLLINAFRRKAPVVVKECVTCMEVERNLDTVSLMINARTKVMIGTNVSVDCRNTAKIKNRLYSSKDPKENIAINERTLRSVIRKNELCMDRERMKKGECDYRYSTICRKTPLKEYKGKEDTYIRKNLKHLEKRKSLLKRHELDVRGLDRLIRRRKKLLREKEEKEKKADPEKEQK